MSKATSKKGRGRPPASAVRSSVRLAGRPGRITDDEEDESAAEGEQRCCGLKMSCCASS